MISLGPLEIVLLISALVVGILMLYAAYRLGYRVGRAEGALQGSERTQKAA